MDAMQFSTANINKCTPTVNNQPNKVNHMNDSLSLVDNVGLLSKKIASQIPPGQNIVLDINNTNPESNTYDSFTSSDTELNFDIYNLNSENLSLSDLIAKWVVECNIPNTSTTKLLKVLKTRHCFDKSLPSDARTLFKTVNSNRGIQIRSVSPDLYYHFGIANGIHNYYKKYISSIDDSDIKLVFGIDGLPLAKSSNSTFRPILCYIRPNDKYVFPVGLFWGNFKPDDSNDFLEDFCAELKILLTDGIILKNKFGILFKKKVLLDGFCCDVPAKSFILYCKGHSGYFSCFRCMAEGEYIKNKRVRFPELDSQKR